MKKDDYYTRISYASSKIGSNIPLEKVEYSRSWLLGSTYADSLTKNGSKMHKAKNDKYLNDLKKEAKKGTISKQGKAFLNGVNSFLYD